MRDKIAQLAQCALAGERINRDQASILPEAAVREPYELMYWAHRVRLKFFSNAVRLCSIVPGKLGACKEDCKWCAQSIHSQGSKISPKRTSPAEIRSAASAAAANGSASIGIVNSGRQPTTRDLNDVIEAVRQARSDNASEIEFCASLGELTNEQAAQLAKAGITRYHHNLETSRRHFPNVVTSHSYNQRIETLAAARAAGMSTCCGGLFGIGENWEDRIDLALTIRDEVDPDETPLNFLQPIPGTPMEQTRPLEPMEILAIIAIFRLIMPTVNIKIAGGRQYNLRDLQSWAFYAGATGCIVGNYLTTTGREVNDDLQMFKDLGLTVVQKFPANNKPQHSHMTSI